MHYIAKIKNNKIRYFKQIKENGKILLKRTSRTIYDKYFSRKYRNKKQLSGGFDPNSQYPIHVNNTWLNYYEPNRKYMAMGYDNTDKVIISIEPVFSLARESLIDWCMKLCKYQNLNNKKKLGILLTKKLDGVDGFLDIDKCKNYNDGKYYVEPGSRSGKVFLLGQNDDTGEWDIEDLLFQYPSENLEKKLLTKYKSIEERIEEQLRDESKHKK